MAKVTIAGGGIAALEAVLALAARCGWRSTWSPCAPQRRRRKPAVSPSERPILIAYDGSEDAGAAVTSAGRLFPGRAAIVAHA